VDDGKGFNLDSAMGGAGQDTYGLMGMHERVELLEGKLKINTAPGKGTQIMVQLPLK